MRGWNHDQKWKKNCPVCKAEKDIALVVSS